MNKEVNHKDNRPELMSRIKKDYNLPDNDPIVDAILDATAFNMNRGYAEMQPLTEKYSDLVCLWCGKLHYSERCQEELLKYEQSKETHPHPNK
ncbi:MAG: hypothetical protein ABFD18_06455 [Syntrophomonas sp.]